MMIETFGVVGEMVTFDANSFRFAAVLTGQHIRYRECLAHYA